MENSITLRYREAKATQAAAHLIVREGGAMNHMKLIKLLYLSDRLSIVRRGRPITFDWYYALKHGPVLSFTLDKINEARSDAEPSYWHSMISERTNHSVSVVGSNARDQLSDLDIQALDETYDKYGSMSQWKLRDLTHTLPEWSDPQGSSFPIPIERILQVEGFSKEEIDEMLEAVRAEQALSDALEQA